MNKTWSELGKWIIRRPMVILTIIMLIFAAVLVTSNKADAAGKAFITILIFCALFAYGVKLMLNYLGFNTKKKKKKD
jgi:hypothetical protein